MTGYILAHEHIVIDLSSEKEDIDCCIDQKEIAVNELIPLKSHGFGAIIDQTARGMGRNPLLAKQIADAAKLQLSHATGYYKEPFLPAECYEQTEQELAQIMIGELTNGIGDTGIRAAHIGEIGTSRDRIMPTEKKIFRAAARAHHETGAPICTHTTLGRLAMDQVTMLRDFIVNLSHVVISHVALCKDFSVLVQLADTGVNLGFDTVGKVQYQSDEQVALWIVDLCNRGYDRQIVLSMDITRQSHYQCNGGIGFAYLAKSFIPRLKALGISDTQLDQILQGNARRIYKLNAM